MQWLTATRMHLSVISSLNFVYIGYCLDSNCFLQKGYKLTHSLCSPIMPADWLAPRVGIEPTLHESRDTPRFLQKAQE